VSTSKYDDSFRQVVSNGLQHHPGHCPSLRLHLVLEPLVERRRDTDVQPGGVLFGLHRFHDPGEVLSAEGQAPQLGRRGGGLGPSRGLSVRPCPGSVRRRPSLPRLKPLRASCLGRWHSPPGGHSRPRPTLRSVPAPIGRRNACAGLLHPVTSSSSMLSGAYSMLLGAYIAIRSFGLSVLVPIGASLFASSSASSHTGSGGRACSSAQSTPLPQVGPLRCVLCSFRFSDCSLSGIGRQLRGGGLYRLFIDGSEPSPDSQFEILNFGISIS